MAAATQSERGSQLPEPALYIGHERVTTTSAGVLERMDPTTGNVLSSFPIAGPPEVDRAVSSGRAAFRGWKYTPADERRKILLRIAAGLRAATPELAIISALETGTPSAMSPAWIDVAADHFEYYAGWADKLAGELVHAYPHRSLDYVKYEPYGVVAALITWNGPIVNAAMKVAPALAAGNCIVLKSPELGPFATMRLAEICSQAGLPDGVLSVISGGAETADALIRHPGIAKVSFTGGPTIASEVMKTAAETTKPVLLELGGKSANVVFADADLDAAAQMGTFLSVIAVSGQGCFFPTRLLVQDSVYDEVVDRVRAIAESPTVGDPLDPAVMMGPVISEQACARIMGYIDGAKADGSGRLVTGGTRLGGDLSRGYFVAPTVFADVDNSSRIAQEEIFGPVLSVIRFSDEAEAVAVANDTKYGLAAFVHTQDLVRAHRVADELEAGMVSVNSFAPASASLPFGGTKGSGFGREGSRAAIEEYFHHKNVFIPLG